MNARDLFTVILKIFGIFLIKDVLLAIPPVLNEIFKILEVSVDLAFFSLLFYLLTLGLHLAVVYLLLFKTKFLISKLNLASELSDEPMKVNMHRSSIYTVAIIVTGLLILVFAIPTLIQHFYFWYEFMDSRKGSIGDRSYDYSGLFIAIAEVIIGLLFLGNQRALVNYIEIRRRGANGG